MTKILGMDSAYDQAVEAKGRPMVISPTLVVEMVDRIRELEKDGWISVEDRLPVSHGEYLVYMEDKEDIYRKCTSSVYDCDGWFYELLLGTKVTHWMPLPEPPKEEL